MFVYQMRKKSEKTIVVNHNSPNPIEGLTEEQILKITLNPDNKPISLNDIQKQVEENRKNSNK